MAEINNSLALGIKPVEFDITKPLEAAAKINSLRASTAQTEQQTQYNQFQQDQNQGYRVPDVNTLAEAHQKQIGLAGQIGNMLANDPSPTGVRQAIDLARKAGVPVDPNTEQHLLSAPKQQIVQYGQNMQRAGQTSTANIEQSPPQIAQRNQAATGGSTVGGMYGPPGFPGAPSPSGPSGAAPNGPVPNGAPPVAGGPQNLSLMERKTEAEQNAGARAKEFEGYRNEADTAGEKKVALRQILIDADRVRTGKGETKINEARKWLQTASQFIPGLDTSKLNDPVAAFESLEKNRGIVARAAMKGVGGTAASELEAISGSLASGETSHKGIETNVSQLNGLENAKKARFQAAQDYQDRYGSLKGFAADFNKNAGPAAWVYMALPPEERQSIRDTLNKTPQGKNVINSIARQMNYIHKNKLDEGID